MSNSEWVTLCGSVLLVIIHLYPLANHIADLWHYSLGQGGKLVIK
ncbi:hypothetical protein [Sutcliffiella horikoshii]